MWVTRHAGLPELIVFSVAASPDGSTLLAGVGEDGIFRSTDGGNTWAVTPGTAGEVSSIVHCQADPTVVYAASLPNFETSGVFRSTDSGATWTRESAGMETNGARRQYRGLLVDPSDCFKVMVASDKGFFLTTDGGGTWQASSTGLPELFGSIPLYALARSVTDANTLYVGLETGGDVMSPDGALYKSTDGGASWTAAGSTMNILPRSIAISQASPNTIYVAGERATLLSTDGGATFTRLPDLPDPVGHYASSIAVSPADAAEVFLDGPGGVYRSADSGTTWTLEYAPAARAFFSAGVDQLRFIPRPGGMRLAAAGSFGLAIRE